MLRVAGLNVPLCADADARACALALKKLRLTDVNVLSPIEALNLLAELKQDMNG